MLPIVTPKFHITEIVVGGNTYQNVPFTALAAIGATAAQIEAELAKFNGEGESIQLKIDRALEVSRIIVTTSNDNQFNGDEDSQNRMARAIQCLIAAEQATTSWKLADNTVAEVTVAEMQEALILSGQAQTALWFV